MCTDQCNAMLLALQGVVWVSNFQKKVYIKHLNGPQTNNASNDLNKVTNFPQVLNVVK